MGPDPREGRTGRIRGGRKERGAECAMTSPSFSSVLPHQPPTCHIILREWERKKLPAVERGDPTCDREQDEQPERLHVTLPLRRADSGFLVQDLVFPLNCRKERVRR